MIATDGGSIPSVIGVIFLDLNEKGIPKKKLLAKSAKKPKTGD